ncbi:MAG: EcsC family protein [Alphaproteobacteria bacterium]|nr:EcsC family protein [Alphaproteobacteria bacterium]
MKLLPQRDTAVVQRTRGALVATLLQAFDWAYDRAVDGVPGLDGATDLATSYAARHATTEEAVSALILRQSGIASVAGFLTGVGGFVALPVAMPANLASALYIQVRLIAAIAHLRGHDLQSSDVRALVLACLTGSKAADTMRDAAVRFGTRLSRDVLGWASPAVMKKVQHATHFAPLAHTAGQSVAKLGKFVPVVGGVLAGGFDAAMTQLVGRTADRIFTNRTPSAPATVEPVILLQ